MLTFHGWASVRRVTNPVHPDPDALPTLVSGTDELPTIATRAPPSSAMGLPGQAAPEVPDFDAPTVAAVIDDPRLATFFNPAAAAPEPAPPPIAPALAPRPPLPPPVAVAPPSPPPPPPVAVAPAAAPPPPPVSGPLPASSFRPATSSGMPAVRPGSGLLDPALPPSRPVTSSMPSLRPGSAGLDPAVPPPNRPATSSGMPVLRSGDVPAPVRPKTSSGMPSLRTGEVSGGVPVAQRTGEVGVVPSAHAAGEAPTSGVFKAVMAGGLVVISLLMVVATRGGDAVPAPSSSSPPPSPSPVVKAVPSQRPRPPHLEEIRKLSVQFTSSMDSPAGRDALYARAKIHAEHKDYRNATEDLRRLLYRRDVAGALRQEIEGLLRTLETERRNAGR